MMADLWHFVGGQIHRLHSKKLLSGGHLHLTAIPSGCRVAPSNHLAIRQQRAKGAAARLNVLKRHPHIKTARRHCVFLRGHHVHVQKWYMIGGCLLKWGDLPVRPRGRTK